MSGLGENACDLRHSKFRCQQEPNGVDRHLPVHGEVAPPTSLHVSCIRRRFPSPRVWQATRGQQWVSLDRLMMRAACPLHPRTPENCEGVFCSSLRPVPHALTHILTIWHPVPTNISVSPIHPRTESRLHPDEGCMASRTKEAEAAPPWSTLARGSSKTAG